MSANQPPGRECDAADHCITCADEGVPMCVMSPASEEGVAICADPNGRQSEVMVGLVGPVQIGDTVLVHAGTAILHLGSGNGGAA